MVDQAWMLNVFCSDAAFGNLTGVVFELEQEVLPYWRIARALRAPDTVFVRRLGQQAFRLRFYSPLEGEMSFCGQGILAADHAIRRALSVEGELTLETAAGPVTSREDAGTHWFGVARSQIQLRACPAALAAEWPRSECRVVDSGRCRAFVRLPDAEQLAGVEMQPARVMELARQHELSGICFYSGDRELGLRVFTLSLGGREDASTGGAVAGLAALVARGRYRIQQGRGGPETRGELCLDSLAHAEEVRVGGAVEAVMAGRLLCAGQV